MSGVGYYSGGMFTLSLSYAPATVITWIVKFSRLLTNKAAPYLTGLLKQVLAERGDHTRGHSSVSMDLCSVDKR